MGHFVVFSNTRQWEKETNMGVASVMTCKIRLISHHMKTLYRLAHSIQAVQILLKRLLKSPHGSKSYSTCMLHQSNILFVAPRLKIMVLLRENYIQYQNWAYFVIISKCSFFFFFCWKLITASWSNLIEKLKNGIKILVGQAVLELLIKTFFCMFDQ